MHSHHSHSGQYCTHATGTLRECVEAAANQGFLLFCLTEHIPRYREEDLYPGEKQTLEELLDMFIAFYAEARQIQAEYCEKRHPMQILVGLETEYIRSMDLRILELLMAKYPVDLIVGSVHHVHGIPIDFDKPTFQRALEASQDAEHFYGTYFDDQFRILERLQPAVIGHFDVILLMAPKGTDLFAWASVKTKMRRNIQYAVAYGALFELNSAAFRKGWPTAYPGLRIVELMQAEGARFCLSDDSHGQAQVGLNYVKMQAYIQEAGITELYHLEAESQAASVDKVQVKAVKTDLDTFMAFKARGEQ